MAVGIRRIGALYARLEDPSSCPRILPLFVSKSIGLTPLDRRFKIFLYERLNNPRV
jgi:hypothetical protein